MKNILLLLFLLLVISHGGANNVDSLITSSKSLLKKGAYLDALKLISLAKEECKKDSDQICLAKVYMVYSNINMKVSKYSDAIQELLYAQKIAIAEDNKPLIAKTYNDLAVLYFETADNREDYINKAESNIKIAYKILKENNIHDNEIILNYGVIVYMYNNPDAALSFFLKEKKIIDVNDHVDHVYINDYIAHIYKNLLNYKKSLEYHYRSLYFSKKDKNISLESMNYANIAYSYFMLNYTDSAFVLANKSYKLAVTTNNKYAMELSIDVLCDIYYKQNNIKLYRKYILIADSIKKSHTHQR